MVTAKRPHARVLLIALIALFSLPPLYAQTYENLVFEGAGIRGVAYVGAIKELEQTSILSQVKRVGGTSAGAIAALTIALGYNSKEIEDIIYNTQLQHFNDGEFFFIGGLNRVYRNYGWYKGDTFTAWVEDIIKQKTGNPEITFRELHDLGFRDLYVTGTSLNHQRLIVFSYETYPDMKVKDALRISISIPLYFEAVYIDKTGRVINKRNLKGYYDLMVDGGFTGNYPISLFDELSQRNGITNHFSNPCTLGLRIDSPSQVDYDKRRNGLAPFATDHFKGYIGACYNYVIENLNRNTLTSEDWHRTVSISSGDIAPRIRKLSACEKDLLITNGQSAMKTFLQNSEKLN